MEILDLLIRWLHVTAAVAWIGGNLILAMVIVPYFKKSVAPVERIKILTRIGKRFESIVWTCVIILIFSGLFNVLSAIGGDVETVRLFMRTLTVKLALFVILIILTGIHSFLMGPRLSQAIEALDPDTRELPEEIDKMRRSMAIVSSLMGVVSLLVLLAAVALRMGI
ncbi:MAG: CopD family protein [Candidatus Poribacteria bacterium]|nr:CopD family protein [Candidatus Poribacteria bacterium]MDE0504406.1 CopD family protein [Candidatus Poribacteria bacterium]